MSMLQRAVKAHKPDTVSLSQGTLAKHVQDGAQTASQEPKQTPVFSHGSTTSVKSAMTMASDSARSAQRSPISRSASDVYSRSSHSHGGLAAALSKSNSFQEQSAANDSTPSAPPFDWKKFSKPTTALPEVDFNIDDFENDEELDIDVEYPTGMPEPPREPLHPISTNITATDQTEAPARKLLAHSIPWSSSPLSHFQTPPGPTRKEAEPVATESKRKDSPIDTTANKPTKRARKLPWGEEPEVEEMEPPKSTTNVGTCFNCQKKGHLSRDCPARAMPATPSSQKKELPWNTTASSLKERQKEMKARQKIAEQQMATVVHAEKSSTVRLSPIILSEEQEQILDMVVSKSKSVFFTGSAGTGKSVLMREIIKSLRRKYKGDPERLSVTASTGLAACNIGGMTLHSFAGIGLGQEDVPALVRKIKKNAKAKNRWLRTKTLIVDEISMVDGLLFDKLEAIGRALRNNGRPFGGIQLVVTGDFFQLPPVADRGRVSKFAFEAATWPTALQHTIGLTQVFRQKDPEFARMLNEMRLGNISNETVQMFKKMSRSIEYDDQIEATELFPTRNEVENANALKMRSLQGQSYTYEAEDSGQADPAMREKLLANMMAPPKLLLKKGAQVMLIKNMDDGLVNGSLGYVRAFMDNKTFAYYDQNPDLLDGNAAEEELAAGVLKAREKLKAMISKDVDCIRSRVYPLVRFTMADGTYRELLVQPEEWKVELPNGDVQAQRRQLPLMLAWALSIHKAQGQTIERVKVDLGKVFEKGQAYVALSRATSKEGLQVLRFDKNKVMAHPKVADFYNSLLSVDKIPRTKPRSVIDQLTA